MQITTFSFDFDETRTKEVRKAIDERSNFAIQTENTVSVKEMRDKPNSGYKRTSKKVWGYDAIYASLDRIEDTLHYINSLELGSEDARKQRSAFDFFDFINNMYVIIHCIQTLGHVFNVNQDEYKRIELATDCFNQPGITGNGNDNDFFEYVRSLVSVHPVETGMHPEYHGYGKIHCSPFAVWTIDGLRDADLSVHIYTAERGEDIETLPLWVNQFEAYLNKWIDFIDVIVKAIKKYNEEMTLDYKQRLILEDDEFNSYDKYIDNLRNELVIRVGEYTDYYLKYYARIFRMELTEAANKHKFDLYKNAIRYSLGFLHKRLQNMDVDDATNTGIIWPDRGLETELYIELWKPRNVKSEISQYGYELEKMSYIDGSGGYNEQYGRRLLDKIKPIINKYVIFKNEEPPFETQVLVSMAMYFESFGYQNLINRNIPNTLEFREVVISDDEWELLIKNETTQKDRENKLRKFLKDNEINVSK